MFGIFIFIITSFNNIFLIKEISNSLPYDTKIKIVEDTSAILPKMDSISHLILKTNENLIKIVADTDLDNEVKKEFILNIVDFCRKGDEIGGEILNFYYNTIDNIL